MWFVYAWLETQYYMMYDVTVYVMYIVKHTIYPTMTGAAFDTEPTRGRIKHRATAMFRRILRHRLLRRFLSHDELHLRWRLEKRIQRMMD